MSPSRGGKIRLDPKKRERSWRAGSSSSCRTRSGRGPSSQGFDSRTLEVPQRRAPVSLPPFPPLSKMGTRELQKAMEVRRRSLWMEHPRAPSARQLFQDDRAIPAVLTLLRETKVGRVINLASLGKGLGG